jgi:hypothetical protein
MRWEWTDRNPAASAKPPTPGRQTILATSPEDVAKVIAEARARSAAMGLYLWLVVVTGVRRGELCGRADPTRQDECAGSPKVRVKAAGASHLPVAEDGRR